MRLIDADAYQYPGDLANEQTIEAEPVRYGIWVPDGSGGYHCNQCGQFERWTPNYCLECGAKMKTAD